MVLHFTVYDIETEPFSDEFRKAKDSKTRLKLAPRARLMVVYSSQTNDYHTFAKGDLSQGVDLILSSDAVVSFNGENFDELVLMKEGCLDKHFSNKKLVSIDLCLELEKLHGYRANLDGLSRLNLNEKKHTGGREMTNLNFDELKTACKSDVSQTLRLYEMFKNNKKSIKYPSRSQRNYLDNTESLLGPFTNLRTGCLECGSQFGGFMDEDLEQMTEGQMADYISGMWGNWHCYECGYVTFIQG